ncbi:thiamine phosphate synthase [Herbidospora sp. RD11066]
MGRVTDPSRRRLANSRLYLCTDGRRERGDLVEFLDAALSGGVDIVQLREKGLEAREELALLEVFRAACDRHGALLSVNDRADIAYAATAAGFGPDVLHLGQDDLPVPIARALLGEEIVIGRSTHAFDEATVAASEPGVDYYCCGPTWPTPTKPGRPAPGLPLLAHASGLGAARPWFAIGGIDLGNLDEVLAQGATRVVVVRAITEAEDPKAAAQELSNRLKTA